MRLIPVVAFIVSAAASAFGQEWIEFASREDGFKLNFPGQPRVTETTYESEYGAKLPARVYTSDRGRERYSMTVVNYDPIEKLLTERARACPPWADERCTGFGGGATVGRRVLENGYPRRARLGLVAVPAARREADALHVELHGPRGRRSAAAHQQRGSIDRSIQQIAQMKLYEGDDYIDAVVFGESVYTPLHDPMFAVKSNPPAHQLEQWRRMVMEIAKAGLPLHVHANLTNTIDAFLDQIEAVNKVYPVHHLRWALAHVNQINAAQLERMKKLGMYAAVHPWGVINGAIMHEGFGEAAYELAPFATIQKSGITWGLGSDGSAANQYLPMTALHFAVTGKLAGGRTVIRHTISREDALIAYTRKNAYFVFREDDLGSIQAGKLADLVVLDRDYLTVPADEIKDIKPALTMVGGRVVYDAAADTSTR